MNTRVYGILKSKALIFNLFFEFSCGYDFVALIIAIVTVFRTLFWIYFVALIVAIVTAFRTLVSYRPYKILFSSPAVWKLIQNHLLNPHSLQSG